MRTRPNDVAGARRARAHQHRRRESPPAVSPHDPNLEVYADRVLYVADGQFAGQAINTAQSRLDLPSYVKFLNVADDR